MSAGSSSGSRTARWAGGRRRSTVGPDRSSTRTNARGRTRRSASASGGGPPGCPRRDRGPRRRGRCWRLVGPHSPSPCGPPDLAASGRRHGRRRRPRRGAAGPPAARRHAPCRSSRCGRHARPGAALRRGGRPDPEPEGRPEPDEPVGRPEPEGAASRRGGRPEGRPEPESEGRPEPPERLAEPPFPDGRPDDPPGERGRGGPEGLLGDMTPVYPGRCRSPGRSGRRPSPLGFPYPGPGPCRRRPRQRDLR